MPSEMRSPLPGFTLNASMPTSVDRIMGMRMPEM